VAIILTHAFTPSLMIILAVLFDFTYRYLSVAPGLAALAFLIDMTCRVGGGGVAVLDSSLIDWTKPADRVGLVIFYCVFGGCW
jgi:hypothetical protein